MSYGSRKRGHNQGGCVRGGLTSPAYNVELVTNTSSSSCANNERRTPPWVLGSTPSVATLFFALRDSYGWQHCRPVCAIQIIDFTLLLLYSSRIAFFAYPYLHSTPPLGGSRQNMAIPFGKEKLEWLGYPMVKKIRRYLYSFWRNSQTWQTHGQTDTAWRHRPRLCIASRGKIKLDNDGNKWGVEGLAWNVDTLNVE